ncbi:uncharacterized protein LOC124150364 [Haliotis rufescens]|uniref:uncharacterized protein LOC124150364 n=1 Tax=Haliotis rufescens TaxID=6454 RepID=UPI00201EC26C|nr:uncharacterized protein LOC124150364 [Haliotis rufescens]
MRLLIITVVLVLVVGCRPQAIQKRDVKCSHTKCGVNEVCVTDGSGERCECNFGFIKTQGNIYCQPSNTERPLDKIIRTNRLKGILHELFEGDMKLNLGQKRAIDVFKELYSWNILGKRNIFPFVGIDTNLTDSLPDIPIQYWRLPVPVAFSPDVPDSVQHIVANMGLEGNNFFRPYTDRDIDYVMLRKGPGCWSYVGRQGGMQEVAVDDGCISEDMIMHLFLHTLGMWHEQNRADRDEYITLHPLNMEDGAMVNFHRYHLYETKDIFNLTIDNYTGHHLPLLSNSPNASDIEKYFFTNFNCSGLNYDICSLLHIGPFAYSKNGEPVFSPLIWRDPCGKENFQHDITVLGCSYALHFFEEYHSLPAGCFPPSSLVQMKNGRTKTMRELMIGDTVMVMDEEGRISFSDVHLMMHKLDHTPVEYVILYTEDGPTLTLSKEHVVFVTSVWSLSPETRMASKVEVGDYLFRPEMTNGSFVPVKVTAIRKQVITGAYAPTTLAGTVVVDGHLASSYVFVEDQSMVHGFFLPWRIGYHMYNAIFGKSLYVPATGLHWSLRAFVSLYCRIADHEFCDDILKI